MKADITMPMKVHLVGSHLSNPDSVGHLPTVVPALSDKMREVIKQRAEDVVEISREHTSELLKTLPSYRDQMIPGAERNLYDSVLKHKIIWLRCALTLSMPSDEEREIIARTVPRRIERTITLSDYLSAIRMGMHQEWLGLMHGVESDEALQQELLFVVSPYLYLFFENLAQIVIETYAMPANSRMRMHDRLRQDLCALIFNRPDDVENFDRIADALTLDVSSKHCAVALRFVDLDEGPEQIETTRSHCANALVRHLNMENIDGLIYGIYQRALLAWVKLPSNTDVIDYQNELSTRLAHLVKSVKAIDAVGIGLFGSGPKSWNLSAHQAIKAMHVRANAQQPGVYNYAEIAMYDAMTRNELTRQYFDAIVQKLASESHLLSTLEAYFAFGQHHKIVSAKLGIHVNTLKYRLDRIESLLGAKLSDAGWISKIHAALKINKYKNIGH